MNLDGCSSSPMGSNAFARPGADGPSDASGPGDFSKEARPGDSQAIDRYISGRAVVGHESVPQGISSSPPTPALHRDSTVSPEGAARIALQRALTLASSLPLHDRTVPAVYSVRDSSEEHVLLFIVYFSPDGLVESVGEACCRTDDLTRRRYSQDVLSCRFSHRASLTARFSAIRQSTDFAPHRTVWFRLHRQVMRRCHQTKRK